MPSDLLEVSAAPRPANTDDDTQHFVCCDPDTAMCGEDVTGQPWAETEKNVCPLCELVYEYDLPCPVKGCRR